MEISYFVVLLALIAAFAVLAFLAFRASRRAEIEGQGETTSPGPRDLCYECLGSSNLGKDRMAKCSSACGVMPD